MTSYWKAVIWERENKTGKWCPYSSEVCQLLEQSLQKNLDVVCLGQVDTTLQAYSVNLKDLIQTSASTGTVLQVRRQFCDNGCALAQQVLWQWHISSKDEWQSYDSHLLDYIESSFQLGKKVIDLSKQFPEYCYKINFQKMTQQNKQTKRQRSVRRVCTTPFPMVEASYSNHLLAIPSASNCNGDEANAPIPLTQTNSISPATVHKQSKKKALVAQVGNLWNKITKTDSDSDVSPECSDNGSTKRKHRNGVSKLPEEYSRPDSSVPLPNGSLAESNNSSTQNTDHPFALVNGRPWKNPWPPHTPQSEIRPVPGITPLPYVKKKSKKQRAPDSSLANAIDVISEYTEGITILASEEDEEQICIICYESLTKGSSYDGDTTVIKLKVCQHMFHKSCIKAMYDSGSKDKFIQCPTCKEIHGVKYGIQPPGKMVYCVLPYSLPGHHDCDTIRIVYDIPPGIQGPEHPSPGSRYSARGFPRYCYLPDNEIGRKILRLLVKAWERRLIFTIGPSSTTGEQNTVTWNEIHHKTEFGFNRHGHGYPDPNYFENVISELAAHGVVESTYAWYPA